MPEVRIGNAGAKVYPLGVLGDCRERAERIPTIRILTRSDCFEAQFFGAAYPLN